MKDIVERLRDDSPSIPSWAKETMREAAAEIERLRAERGIKP